MDWDGPSDPSNPLGWSRSLKIYHTYIPSAIALVCTTASSIITPGVRAIQEDFNVSREVSLLPYVLYVFGLAFGPLLSGPLSERFGRRPVYRIGIGGFICFTIGAGFSQSIVQLVVTRFFAGVFGSPGLTIGSASLADLWEPKERAVPFCIYISLAYLGPAIGPLIGGFAVVGKGWRWTQWCILFLSAATILPTLGMRETYKASILRQRQKRDERNGSLPKPVPRSKMESMRFIVTKVLTRPIHMACVEPIVGLFTLYIGVNFGMTYAFFAAYPYVFAEAYGFGIAQTGLTFLGLGVGSVVGCALMVLAVKFPPQKYLPCAKNKDATAPEHRLYPAMFGSLCMPVSLFWFGWSVEARVHWICPVIAEGVFAMGNLLVFTAALFYMNQFYGSLYAASANGANSLARYVLGGVFPLFIVQMYGGLGIGWASSLLGFVSLLLLPVPWVFYRIGSRLRENSQYVPSQ